jgi:hypothetical protein
MVGTTGIEPVTPAMSMQCSPAELRSLFGARYIALELDCKSKKGIIIQLIIAALHQTRNNRSLRLNLCQLKKRNLYDHANIHF